MGAPYGKRRAVGQGSGSPRKDIWDKISALSVPFASIVVGMVGAFATYSYNQSDLEAKKEQNRANFELQKLQAATDRELRKAQQEDTRLANRTQTMERLFPFISSPDPAKREFGYAMYGALGEKELAARLIALNGDKAGGLSVLKALAKDPDPRVSAVATQSLASLENASSAGSVTMRTRSSCRTFAESGFRTNRTPATPADYDAVAKRLGIERATLEAVLKVETRGSTLPDGRPRILFERHFFKRLTGGQFDAQHPGVSNAKFGGYAGGAKEYERLTEAASLNCPAALASTSWGAFQLMGSHYRDAGYENVDDYVKDVIGSGPKELAGAASFFEKNGLVEPLRRKDWAGFARKMNGPSYKANGYDQRLAEAYAEALKSAAPTD